MILSLTLAVLLEALAAGDAHRRAGIQLGEQKIQRGDAIMKGATSQRGERRHVVDGRKERSGHLR